MAEGKLRLPLFTSLSARLLVLTIFFVMLSEVLIFAPSIGRYRVVYLEDRISAAHLATLALEATPDNMISDELEQELLTHVRAHVVVLQKPRAKVLMLSAKMPPKIDASFELGERKFFDLIGEAFMTLLQDENRVLRVRGVSPKDPDIIIEVVLDEWPMRMKMLDYSRRILVLSIVISLITATLVYLSLQWLMVWPMRRMTASMVAFREEPENAARVIAPSARSDEIGVAQRELGAMQVGLRAALKQREKLATLGEAVTKINHDLRNILSTARLVSDRLSMSDDPEVKRSTPILLKAIDRAVTLCTQTLNFTRAEPEINRSRFDLARLVDDVRESVSLATEGDAVVLENEVAGDIELYADRDQLFRVLVNLGKNAVEAGAAKITIGAVTEAAGEGNGRTVIEVADDGPGIAEAAREKLFRPFAGSQRPGGTGLGLAIAREIMEAHGGGIELVETGPAGAIFRLDLPAVEETEVGGG
jgi:signal transduction histidine kinase